MTLPMKKATATTTVNDDQTALLLGESVRLLVGRNSELPVGDHLSWAQAGDRSAGEQAQRSVLVDFAELVSHEAVSRYKALMNVCGEGSELLVLSSSHQLDLGSELGEFPMFPLGALEQSVSAIKMVLPFEATLIGVDAIEEGRVLFRLRLGTVTVPVLDEVIPTPQHLWSAGGLGLYLGTGFYALEQEAEGAFCWMGAQGSILVQSSATQLVKVELWVEPFISRPQKLTFGGNDYLLVGKTKVTAYRSIIPGYNPVDLVVDGEVYSPLDRGISTDARKLSLKVIGGKVFPL